MFCLAKPWTNWRYLTGLAVLIEIRTGARRHCYFIVLRKPYGFNWACLRGAFFNCFIGIH